MEKIFCNENSNTYYVLFGGQGERSFLCNVNREQYVICAMLDITKWYRGQYFEDFESAYKTWREENEEE